MFWPPAWHLSYHASGETHLTLHKKAPKLLLGVPTRQMRQRPEGLAGAETLAQFMLRAGDFEKLPECDPCRLPGVLLDADGAGFRNDGMSPCIFLAQPGADVNVPGAAEASTIARETVRQSRPWIVCALFQTTNR